MAASKKDYYEVLGVNKDATEEEIKKILSQVGDEVSPWP